MRGTARKHLEGLVDQGLAMSEWVPNVGRSRLAAICVAAGHCEPDVRVRDYCGLAAASTGHTSRTSADPESDALTAGDSWRRALVGGVPSGCPARPRRMVVDVLSELGFDPETDAGATTARLRRRPLLDTARAFPDVVCPVHLGIVRGALAALGGDPEAAALLPFSEVGACRLHLRAHPPRAGR